MSEPIDLTSKRPRTYLLHARPRLKFHLGHLKMLNTLYRILVEGDNVILLLIPYDEHERHNQTIKARLREEIDLAKGFYRNYLGFDEPRLKIISTWELDLPRSRLLQIQTQYSRIYDGESSAARQLIEEQNRAWASPNILFVPKCIAAIEKLHPDRLICGEKHRTIAECFDEVLRAIGVNIAYQTFDNFLDLFQESAMDSTDSVHSYIDINDDEDFVLHKLSLLRNQPGPKSAWLEDFMNHILEPAPERVKNDINRVHRSQAEREIALTKLLANVRRMIPYSIDEREGDVCIAWGGNVSSSFANPQQRLRIERIARQLYQDGNSTKISLYRVFSAGKSGATVLEVREHESPDEFRVSNVSVLKIGPEYELRREQENYDNFVKNRGTAAFMTVKRSGASADSMAGIVYQDAQHHLGMRLQDRINNISALFHPVHYDFEFAQERLRHLLVAHLHHVLYRHGSTVDADSMRRYVNEFLMAEYHVEVSRYQAGSLTIVAEAGESSDQTLSEDVEISEVDLRERSARAYTLNEHTKIDIVLVGGDEILLNEVTPGRRLRLEGRILATRQNFYNSLLERLGITREGALLSVQGARFADPARYVEEFLDREHYSFMMSPIHGDLHAGNILFSRDGFGIIDYGKMRDRFPSLYDVVYLYADLKTRFVGSRFDIPTLLRLENSILSGHGRRGDRKSMHQLSQFEYDMLPPEIKSLGTETTFYSLLGLILLGRLKFDVSETAKRVGLVLAHGAFERTERAERDR
jgi:hypothetical protein